MRFGICRTYAAENQERKGGHYHEKENTCASLKCNNGYGTGGLWRFWK